MPLGHVIHLPSSGQRRQHSPGGGWIGSGQSGNAQRTSRQSITGGTGAKASASGEGRGEGGWRGEGRGEGRVYNCSQQDTDQNVFYMLNERSLLPIAASAPLHMHSALYRQYTCTVEKQCLKVRTPQPLP